MKDYFSLICDRQSCRDYADRPIEKEILFKCVEAAGLAPSARNCQPWRFTIVNRPDLCKRIAACAQEEGFNQFTDYCPAFIVVQPEIGSAAAEKWHRFDLGLAVMQLCLAAEDLGAATCIMGSIGEEHLVKTLGLSPDAPPVVVVAIGYAATPEHRPKIRKQAGDYVTYLG